MLTEKPCTKCRVTKPAAAFAPRPEVSSGLSSWCRKCCSAQINRVTLPARRKFQKEQLIAHMGGKCMRCLGVFPYYVFDFHHRDPSQKEMNLTSLNDKRWDRIIAEAAKCDLLCSNCHRIAHHRERDTLPPPPNRLWNAKRLADLQRHRSRTSDVRAIAAAMGLSPKQISDGLYRHGVAGIPNRDNS